MYVCVFSVFLMLFLYVMFNVVIVVASPALLLLLQHLHEARAVAEALGARHAAGEGDRVPLLLGLLLV